MGLTMMSPMRPRRRHPAWRWLGARGGTWLASGLVLLAIAAACPATAAAGASTPSGYAVTILDTLSPNPNLSSIAAAGINEAATTRRDSAAPTTRARWPAWPRPATQTQTQLA